MDRQSRLLKILLSAILCIALASQTGIGNAWADQISEQESASDQVTDTIQSNSDTESDEDNSSDGELITGEGENQLGVLGNETEPPDSSKQPIDTSGALLLDSSIEYRVHVQNIGWQDWVSDGAGAGTTGRSLRLEALDVQLHGNEYQGSVNYCAHVQDIGWLGTVSDGSHAGTTGRSLRLEAIWIALDGEIANHYSVYYRVHVQNFGWLGWAKDGANAGSAGYGYRLEAVEIVLVPQGGPAPGDTANCFRKPPMTLQARAHSQNIGWQGWVQDGAVVGTTGRSLRLEAFALKVSYADCSGSIEYSAHIQNIGWQSIRRNGEIAGTTGSSLRVEAIKVNLTGELADNFDVYYRVHVSNIGWLGWAQGGSLTGQGEVAGVVGMSCRIEALQVVLAQKVGGVSTPPGTSYAHNPLLVVSGEGQVAGSSWQSMIAGSNTIGTTGQSLRLEAFKLWIEDTNLSGSIEYCAHLQDSGWQGWTSAAGIAGLEDSGQRIEAIRIRLTGDLAKYFDVYYRAYSQYFGWLGWACNGANAGTTKIAARLEAFQIAIVLRGNPAPGSTTSPYRESLYTAAQLAMNSRVAGLSSSTGWLLAIDSTNCILGVYERSDGTWVNRYFWACSPGAWNTPTVKGIFYIGNRGYVFGNGFSCYYWTQFYGDYLIHSVTYYPGTFIIMEGKMGVNISHGCVRLEINNAKWIYDNIPRGTTVLSY